ncbi:hypothetical protein K458DRAFT_437136 [Lentithecium fluviatile CBS 122367]|uniref:Response regulatory domain-containing protein n=1 Tax=Lentithecium fluviatile CBS 122367 TaxID=1168545 RepID=A0A6G1IEF6_9PLEO|nr:hypothetical protein K458DRAFT_437136 [Lentithecium fluviatile CBS 122367]
MSGWSSQLRSITNLVMQDPRPTVVFWGPDLIMIYNKAEIELFEGFHPCMGDSARIALASVWSRYFESIIERNLAGEMAEKTNTSIPMVRNGFMEDMYLSLKFIPILDSENASQPLRTHGRYYQRGHLRARTQTLQQLSEEVPHESTLPKRLGVDTSRGLSDFERELSFARFSEGSPRTSIDYGVPQREQPNQIQYLHPDETERPGQRLSENGIAAAELNVLVAEDNPVNQRVLTKQLRNLRMKVALANHGGEALEYPCSTDYCTADGSTANKLSLILMDWEMPIMDG